MSRRVEIWGQPGRWIGLTHGGRGRPDATHDVLAERTLLAEGPIEERENGVDWFGPLSWKVLPLGFGPPSWEWWRPDFERWCGILLAPWNDEVLEMDE